MKSSFLEFFRHFRFEWIQIILIMTTLTSAQELQKQDFFSLTNWISAVLTLVLTNNTGDPFERKYQRNYQKTFLVLPKLGEIEENLDGKISLNMMNFDTSRYFAGSFPLYFHSPTTLKLYWFPVRHLHCYKWNRRNSYMDYFIIRRAGTKKYVTQPGALSNQEI